MAYEIHIERQAPDGQRLPISLMDMRYPPLDLHGQREAASAFWP